MLQRHVILKAIVAVATIWISSNANAQAPEKYASNPVPSPDAASLGKFGDVQVSTYTGVPDISIPIYTIKEKDIEVPISLSYHAGGIKVSEEASWVGLGWALNAGGTISRMIRGWDDFNENGFARQNADKDLPDDGVGSFQTSLQSNITCNTSGNYTCTPTMVYPYKGTLRNFYEYLVANYDISGGATSFDPNDQSSDLFYYSFPGDNGKFVFDRYGTIKTLIDKQTAIKFLRGGVGGNGSWEITTVDGTRYYFGTDETAKQYSTTNPSAYFNPSSSDPHTSITSWFLVKIVSSKGSEVNFEYDKPSEFISDIPSYSRSKYSGVSLCKPQTDEPVRYYSRHEAQYLRKITFTNGYILFERDLDNYRADLDGARRLKSIKVFAKQPSGPDKQIKEVTLNNNSYFQSTLSASNYLIGYPAFQEKDKKRLKLVSVVEKDENGQENTPYTFNYNEALPYKSTFNVDHWGYYNGNNGNNDLIPSLIVSHSAPFSVYWEYHPGADRETNPQYVGAGLLSKITYPTGGYTNFDYESNTYTNWTTAEYVKVKKSGSINKNNQAPLEVSGDITQTGYATYQFTLNSHQPRNGVKVTAFFGCAGAQYPVCDTYTVPPRIVIDNVYYNLTKGITETIGLVKASGPHTIELKWPDDVDGSDFTGGVFVVNLSWDNETEEALTNKPGGGVRVKQITDFDPIKGQATAKVFLYTSGKLMSEPHYVEKRQCLEQTSTNSDGTPSEFWPMPGLGQVILAGGYQITEFKLMQSQSVYAISSSAAGNVIGYDKVEIYNGVLGENGKTVLEYMNRADIIPFADEDQNMLSKPSIPYLDNGTLLKKSDYKNGAGIFKKVKMVSNTYPAIDYSYPEFSISASEANYVQGVWALQYVKFNSQDNNAISLIAYHYPTPILWNPLLKTEETIYNDDLTEMVSSTEYFYDDLLHKQLSKTLTVASDGKKIYSHTLYPQDYLDNPGFIADLKSAHILNAPIEQISYEELPDGTKKILSGVINEYQTGGSGLLKKVHQLEINDPLATTNFRYSNRSAIGELPPSGANSYFYLNTALYKPKMSIGYTNELNLQEVAKENDNYTTLLWGYNNTLPIAQVINARMQATEIVTPVTASFTIQEYVTVTTPTLLSTLTLSQNTIVNLNFDYFSTLIAYPGTHHIELVIKNSLGVTQHTEYFFEAGTKTINLPLIAGSYQLLYTTYVEQGYPGGSPFVRLVVNWSYQLTNNSYNILHTSFEDAGEGNSTQNDARTGRWSKTNGYSKLLSGLTPGAFILTYWNKISGTWTFQEQPITVTGTTYTINLTGQVDEIRFYPASAKMTTYTHDPLIGVTSTTDANNLTSYYEYDSFNRLKLIRDDNGNILKKYTYHLKDQN